MTIATDLKRNDDSLAMLDVSCIVTAPWGNVRRANRNPAKWAEFLADVKLRGIIQPITVRPHPEQVGVFELVAGYGRWEAAKLVGCPLPALVVNCSDAECIGIGLTENLQREDMSAVDEALAAQTAVGLCNGDYEEARMRLGWTMNRLKQRLHLTRCAPAVLDAVSANTLSLRHADLLAGISAEAQNALLTQILEKNLSVETVKSLLGKASIAITKARFDIGDCATCEHNSQQQTALFEEFSANEGAMCRNLICFKKKTSDMVEARRLELIPQYGKIILLTDVALNTINHLTLEAVGSSQIGDCFDCKQHVALLDDRIDTAGDVLANRCTDADCFKKCSARHAKSEQEAAELVQQASATTTSAPEHFEPEVKSQPKPSSPDGKKTASIVEAVGEVEIKISSQVLADHKILLRKAAVKAWGSEPEAAQRFQLAVMLASLKSVAGRSSFGKELPSIIGNPEITTSVLRHEIANTMQFVTERLDSTGYASMVDVMIATLPHAPNARQFATAEWEPTPEQLKSYTLSGLHKILEESGFDDSYLAAHDEKALKKLKSQSKGELIKLMCSHPFDWSDYAPSFFFAAC